MNGAIYEDLIRRVFECGKTLTNGANSTFYHELEQAHHNLSITHMNGTEYERQFSYQSAFAVVRNHVRNAIEEGIDKIGYKIPQLELNKLSTMAKSLNHRFYDKEQLDSIIETADDLFHKHGLSIL